MTKKTYMNNTQTTDEKKLLEELLKRETLLEERSVTLDKKDAQLQKKQEHIEELEEELKTKLEKTTRISPETARDELLKLWEKKLAKEIADMIAAAHAKAKQTAKEDAQEILIDAMRHGATDYVAEYTVSTVKIYDEEVKGRIIGKEGRNIRTFEQATGVDFDLDEEGIIRLSSFDPVRREIARIALIRLIKDGRIQPVRIEETVVQVKTEIQRYMDEEGQKLCHAVGVYNLPQELISLLGRFKYRFSYGQSMIAHTLEETKIGIKLAHEAGVDVDVVKLGCLLHDIGKVIMDKEGNHVELGVELLKRYNMPEKVIGCVASHHEDIEFPSLEAVLVYVSDAISGSRPGARMEQFDEYFKRLKELEEIAKGFPGIEDAFAMQAGREIRVIVDPKTLDDAQTMLTAQKIKEEVARKFPQFPGSISITLVRELHVTEVVK
jgi:ribonuclease Y